MFTQCFTEFGDRAELVPNWGVELSECFFFFLLNRLTSIILKLLNISELQPNGNNSIKLDHLKALLELNTRDS